jgi:hypothetical protein
MIRQVSSRPVSPVSSSKRVVATTVEIAGEIVPLEVNWHATARRFTLRVDPSNGAARLTVPDYVGLNVAIAFLKRHELWLACERGKLDAPVPFVEERSFHCAERTIASNSPVPWIGGFYVARHLKVALS